jgi:hypothetical protein
MNIRDQKSADALTRAAVQDAFRRIAMPVQSRDMLGKLLTSAARLAILNLNLEEVELL